MIQEFNINRVVVEVVPETSRIWTPRKKSKIIDGIIRIIGSKVDCVKPGDSVMFFNEGIVIRENQKEYRIVNDLAVVLKKHEAQKILTAVLPTKKDNQ